VIARSGGRRQFAPARNAVQRGVEEQRQAVDHGPCLGLADAPPLLGRLPGHLALDGEKQRNPFQGVLGQGRAGGGVNVEDFPAHMGHAGDLGHGGGPAVLGFVQGVESGIAIGMQMAAKAGQFRLRMLTPAIGRVAVQHRRRHRSGMGTFVAQIHP